MKAHGTAVALALPLLASQVLAACIQPTVRRDWRSLSEAERSHFIDVQQQFWRQNPDAVTGLSDYDEQFTLVHRNNTPRAHQVPTFFPWHRRFLRDYEAALRTVDPDISLPYWNWAADNERLAESEVFADAAFGGDGDKNAAGDHCVQTGRYANWTLLLGGDLADPAINIKHCLRRVWSRGIGVKRAPGQKAPVPNEAEIAGNVTELAAAGADGTVDFDRFRRWFEPHHGTIHQGVGGFSMDLNGDLTAVDNSPNEPMFWLHHAFVDRCWWQFQQQGPAALKAYDGLPSARSRLPRDDPMWTEGAKLSDLMAPWEVTVESAMYTNADDYCYTYE